MKLPSLRLALTSTAAAASFCVPVTAVATHTYKTVSDKKYNICHRVEGATNPWAAVQIDSSAADFHLKHGDFTYKGETKNGKPSNSKWCNDHGPKPTPTPTPSVTPQPTPTPTPIPSQVGSTTTTRTIAPPEDVVPANFGK